MVIGFDAQPIFRNRDGVGTYTAETIHAAARTFPDHKFIGTYFSDESSDFKGEFDSYSNVSFQRILIPWQIIRLLAELGIWFPIDRLLKIKFDGFIYTNFVSLPWVSSNVKKILIVHDAVFIHFPETVSGPNLYYLNKFVRKSSSRKNTTIYSVSEHAARDLTHILNKDVRSAPPGPSVLSTKTEKGNHLLFIGTVEPRKNIIKLVRAYERFDQNTKRKHPLFIAGRIGWEDDENFKKIVNAPFVQYLGYVSPDKRKELMESMFGLVMPSLYEGFGIPVLDSAIMKKPILTSLDSPMSEICGKDGAVYVNPVDENSIYDGLKKMISMSSAEVDLMTRESLKSAAKYSWENTAKILMSQFIKP